LSRFFFTSLAVAAAIGLAGCGDSLAPNSQPPAASFRASLVPVRSAGQNPTVTEVRLPIDGGINVGDLAYDESRDAIWFVGADGAGASAFRLDTNSGAIERWPLPAGSFMGFYVQVKTDAAGMLWVADGYQVVRFDRASQRSSAHAFDLRVPGALPGALTGPSPGTWVSSIIPTDDGVIVARHNVPWLTRLDASLAEVGRIPLPQGDEGAEDLAVIGQTIFVERDSHSVGIPQLDILDLEGQSVASVPGRGGRLEVVGERVLRHGHGENGVAEVEVQWVKTDGTTEAIGTGSSASTDPRGGITVFRPDTDHQDAVERVVDGTVVSKVRYPAQLVQLNSCPMPIAPSGNSLPPSCPKAWIVFSLSDLITDRTGVTWYVTTNAQVIYRAEL
jgi:hypothetical protein